MDKKQKEAFHQLWKVEALDQINKTDNDGKVTRSLESDYEMKLRLIAYGFLEGINYIKNSKGERK